VDGLRSELQAILEPIGQGHILAFWDRLSLSEREALHNQVTELDLPAFLALVNSAKPLDVTSLRLEREPFVRLPASPAERKLWDNARITGQEALIAGKVAAMVVAGGQGTRLGFDGPKGAFSIGPLSGRSLFQVHAEKVLAASRRSGREIPFLVMTGPTNDAETKLFLKEKGFFGLPPLSVRVFQQSELPALDADGKVILDSPGHVFASPNGHGGSLKTLWESGAVQWLEGRGVEYISYFQVDNPLVRVIDPVYIGMHIEHGADMSLKLLDRTDPDEKLGIWLRADGKAKVIEYSDLPPREMHATGPDGRLKYAGGSIAIHLFSVAFARSLNERCFRLPLHRARKKVPFVDHNGRTVAPGKENATKFEMFVFDALDFARKTLAIETLREEEFSPVKNAAGIDSPATARRDLTRLYGRWLAAAGVQVPLDNDGNPVYPMEISPLYADDAGTLACNYRGPKVITGPLVLPA
jgi:UDP-N-acetylglucosamine/UDP-N-acetylgalactosamine diphosphorylase